MVERYRGSLEPANSKRKSIAEELVRISDILESRRFNPAPFHYRRLQTLAGVVPQFIKREKNIVDKREIVKVAQDAEIALDYSLREQPQKRPTVLIVPGFTSSGRSPFSVGMANEAIRCGFNAVRISLRGANDPGLSSKTLSHAGLSEDIRVVLEDINNKGLTGKIYIAAFSFGGNMVLKAVGEMGQEAEGKIGGVGLISSIIVDTKNSWEIIHRSPFYEWLVLRELKKAIKRQARADPENWNTSFLKAIKTIEEWDENYQVGDGPIRWGFQDIHEYYEKASALPYVGQISVPTFAIHAQDDPIASFVPLTREQFVNNPNIITMFTKHGGHGGFVNFRSREGDLDRHWAQNRIIEFFGLLKEKS